MAKDHLFSRRALLKGGVALGASALAYRLGMMSAYAQSGTGDYKALVCIFFNGGNDSLNMVAPYADTNYTPYYNARPNIALLRQNDGSGRAVMLPVSSTNVPTNLDHGFHPNFGPANFVPAGSSTAVTLPGLHDLYQQQKVAVVTNVGTLTYPFANKTDYRNNPNKRPRSLFDHAAQTDMWQDMGLDEGWGNGIGRVLLARAGWGTPVPRIPILVNVAGGATVYLAGSSPYITLPFGSQSGNLTLKGFTSSATDQARLTALRNIFKVAHPDPVVYTISDRTDKAITDGQAASDALATAAVTLPFPNTSFGNQMKQIATLIAARSDLSQNKRQVYFASVGGFDTHENQLGVHPGLMKTFNDGLSAFYNFLQTNNLQNNVTTFSLSEFGRTVQNSDSGTDHAWGSNVMVMGGKVNGGQFYGQYPSLILGGVDDIETGTSARGRLLPKISVDQYAATLCNWFGISRDEMLSFLPNLSRFAPEDLGFMNNA